MTSQVDAGVAPGVAEWRDRKRYLWLLGLIPPTALFVMLPIVWTMNHAGWTGVSQALFWVGPFLIYVLLPTLDIMFGPDGQNPPDEAMAGWRAIPTTATSSFCTSRSNTPA